MARDYGQRGSGGRQARPHRGGGGGGGMPGWVWMVAGLAVGLAIAAFVYISRPLKTQADKDNATAVIPDKPDAKKAGPIKLPPKEKPRFTFYELLPNQEVVVPRDAQQPTGKAAAASEDDGLYIIQVASYRKQTDADAQRAKLALLGVESRVEKVTIDNKDTFFRVRIGPEKSLARVHTTMARLEENGVQGMLVKVK